MVSLSRQPVKKLLGYAVRAEIGSEKAYSRMAARVKNPLLQEKFRILALEEKKHKEVLENLFASLYSGEKMPIPDCVDERLLPAVVPRPSSSLAEILEQAMAAEKAAQYFYASLARRVRAGKKEILEYLSKVERSHFLMLRSEYTLAQQFEDYAEKDIDKVIT
ncbi:MAG: ferritin family protein [Acidobacteriota bacterium]